jgi:mono/diheme cytochrome c family protein
LSLSGAAAAMGLPESLVQRSAEARAAETGQSVDDILAAWAGGETIETPPPDTAVESEPVAAEEAQPQPEDPTPEPAAPVIEAPRPSAGGLTSAPTRAPVPAEVSAAEAARLPEVVTVPTAGIRERTNFRIPTWLVGLMLVVPLFALFALGGSSTGACGEATELDTDVISGQIVNCDGSQFTGAGTGGGTADFVALGGEIYNGQAVSGVNCAGCHGGNGEGGVGPALGGVLTTFGACPDHIEWVTLGSAGFPDGHGDTNKPTAGGMPAFGGTLTQEQIAAVSSFERVRFGSGNPDEVLVDCGLAEPEGGDGETTGSTIPGDGETTGSTIPGDAETTGSTVPVGDS